MNIAIKNENSSVFANLKSVIIKSFTGTFSIEELNTSLTGLFYNKAIIDITAIKDYKNEESLFNFLNNFEPNSVVLVLSNDDYCNSYNFLKSLIDKGYYNFAKNSIETDNLVVKSNSYEDVKDYVEIETLPEVPMPIIDNNIPNVPTQELEKFDDFKDSTPVQDFKQTIIGIRNVTPHAGATTLMYEMVKILSQKANTMGIEMLNDDSKYFQSSNIISLKSLDELKLKINELKNYQYIIIDLNGINALDICDDIIYLIEPGMIRLNKLLKSSFNLTSLSTSGKIVLNRSTVKDSELNNFEYETKIKVFANIPDYDDKQESLPVINELLNKLDL